jgi:Protochlamydia outer membrane protein
MIMQKWIKKILTLLPGLCLITVPVDSKNCKLDIGAGYRQDLLEWELAGPDDTPRVLSKLTWKNIRIFEVEAQFRKITDQNIYMRANADYGWIFDGANRDSDFRVEGKRNAVVEFSRSDNKASKGEVYDASAGLGYFLRWCFGSQQLRFAPLGGYSIHEQHLHLFKGFQTIDLDDPLFEGHHFRGLDSTYNTRWHGPWVGMDLYYHINEEITVSGTFEYHWLRYHANGNWNLRSDILGDFIHTGNGQGYFGTLGIDYNFCSGWYIGAQFKYNYAQVTNGKDKTVIGIPINALPGNSSFDDEGGRSFIPFDTEGKLRNIKWTSFSFVFTTGYNF